MPVVILPSHYVSPGSGAGRTESDFNTIFTAEYFPDAGDRLRCFQRVRHLEKRSLGFAGSEYGESAAADGTDCGLNAAYSDEHGSHC